MAKTKVLICPYCGETQPQAEQCRACGGLFEALSRQATHNAMGPWFIRDLKRPFHPGCSYETLTTLLERGQVTKYTVLRGPTTKQLWTVAKHVPGIAHLLGYCHACDASVDPGDHGCHVCGVPFGAYLDRNFMGLPDVRAMPWEEGLEDEETSFAGGASLMWTRPVRGGGLSSFASDDELLSHPTGAAPGGSRMPRADHEQPAAQSADTTATATPAAQTTPAPAAAAPAAIADDPRAVLENFTATAATRALQRRVAGQQRTIRALIAAVAGLAVVATLVVIIQSGRGGADSSSNADIDAAPPTNAPNTSADLDAEADSETSEIEATPAAGDDESNSGGDAAPTNQGDDVPGDSASAARTWWREIVEVETLLDLATDNNRPREDRIGSYEEALAILRRIEQAPSEQHPDELQAMIDQVTRGLDRLDLAEFFGDPG